MLTVVGTGIRCGADLAGNVRSALLDADDVFFLASDPIWDGCLRQLRPDAHSVADLYRDDRPRRDTYEEMVGLVLGALRAGRSVCFAIPGHPGVFAQPTHAAIRRARAEGFSASMLPALSAADHLYADLGIDPGEAGSANFDATDFLVQGRIPDPTISLILWQIGAIGEVRNVRFVNRSGLAFLAETLLETFSAAHEVVVYEAARSVICDSIVLPMRLDALAGADVPLRATLYVPPATVAPLDPDRMRRLGVSPIPV
jgi:uncharacterized protein YabN with tetrapyrrole methylase and pyrophosphatase domain